MAVQTTKTNKPINPRGNDQSPKGYNRAALYSGKALDFDGVNDEVNIGAISGSFTDYSLSWYIQTSTTSAYSCIFTNENSESDWYITNAGQLRVYSGAGDETTSLPPLNDGKLKHVVASITGDQLSVYINGALGQTISYSRTNAFSINASRIGRLASGLYPYDGLIAGFKFFNTALTAAQVSDLYNNPEKIVPTGVADSALKLWLPMMEGAGTTAYDGSGGGNHGTISGATWTHGIGSPVAQTAVIDWNKTSNLLPYSEEFNQWTQFGTGGSITANNTTAPDGLTTADKFTFPAAARTGYLVSASVTASVQYRFGIWLKADSATTCRIFVDQGCANFLGAVVANVTTEWQLFSVDITPVSTANAYFGIDATTDTITACGSLNVASTFYAWGAFAHLVTQGDAYVKTGATAQTSDVLLPQGLTSGRDITGVNLFENVRKQGALNLDGNSWAEVHDNASLDITDAITLEAWVQNSDEDGKGILGRWFSGTACYMLYKPAADNNFNFYINANYVSSGTVTARDWHHVVGVYDGATKKIYVNGVLANSLTETATINTSSDPIEIGRFYSGPDTRTLANQLAQPRIYNRALTAEEVARNYSAGKNTYKN